jgi:molybdenum cofactor cytidylyltransferase
VSRIAVLIPAAGSASRFGSCKQLVEMDGKSLLQHAVDRANTIAPGAVFVVTGADHGAIAETLRDATPIRNPAWRDGLGGSIAHGIERLAPDFDGILIVLADQVALTGEDLQRLCDGFDGGNIVCARYRGRRGVPALFCRESFPLLRRLSGDRGAQPLLYEQQLRVSEMAMERAAVDIDTAEDLDRWLEMAGSGAPD